MRVSSSGLFQAAVDAMLRKQSNIALTQQQLSTGYRMPSAASDPVAWSTAVSLDRSLAELEQFQTNATMVGNRLLLAEQTLGDVNDRLQRIRELTLQAANGVNGLSDRRAIAAELQEQLEALVGQANTSDGNGRFLFGGTQDASAPFSYSALGTTYTGDQTRRQLDVAPHVSVGDVDPGSEVFMRSRTGNGTFTVRPQASNTGTGAISSAGVTNPALWDGGNYRIVFTAGGNYQVLDAASAVVSSGPYVADTPIQFRGISVTISVAPAVGDVFNVAPSGTQDMFTTVQNVINTLNSNSITPTEQARFRNAIFNNLEDLDQIQSHVIDVRANMGARLHTIDAANNEREASTVQLKTTLSSLRDLEYTEAISRLNQEMMALEAAQQTFAKTQDLNLFNYIR
jgi:flagellar hook-associated protein 3 FlgL